LLQVGHRRREPCSRSISGVRDGGADGTSSNGSRRSATTGQRAALTLHQPLTRPPVANGARPHRPSSGSGERRRRGHSPGHRRTANPRRCDGTSRCDERPRRSSTGQARELRRLRAYAARCGNLRIRLRMQRSAADSEPDVIYSAGRRPRRLRCRAAPQQRAGASSGGRDVRRTGLVIGALVAVVSLAACSSGDDGGDSPDTTSRAVVATVPSTTTSTSTTTTAPPTTTTTAPPPPPTTTTVYVPPPPAASASYANCSEARAAGVTPLHRGDPGYSSKLDRDGDGIACE
jgi:hypothetical protein